MKKNAKFLFTFSVIPDSPPRLETRQLSPSPEKEIPPVSCLQVGVLTLQLLWCSFSICFILKAWKFWGEDEEEETRPENSHLRG